MANTTTHAKHGADARFEERLSKQRDTSKAGMLDRTQRGPAEMLEGNSVAPGQYGPSDKVSHVADYIAELNKTAIVEDLRDIARRKPLWFFGGAFGLGLLLARFARSTRVPERYTARASA